MEDQTYLQYCYTEFNNWLTEAQVLLPGGVVVTLRILVGGPNPTLVPAATVKICSEFGTSDETVHDVDVVSVTEVSNKTR